MFSTQSTWKLLSKTREIDFFPPLFHAHHMCVCMCMHISFWRIFLSHYWPCMKVIFPHNIQLLQSWPWLSCSHVIFSGISHELICVKDSEGRHACTCHLCFMWLHNHETTSLDDTYGVSWYLHELTCVYVLYIACLSNMCGRCPFYLGRFLVSWFCHVFPSFAFMKPCFIEYWQGIHLGNSCIFLWIATCWTGIHHSQWLTMLFLKVAWIYEILPCSLDLKYFFSLVLRSVKLLLLHLALLKFHQ